MRIYVQNNIYVEDNLFTPCDCSMKENIIYFYIIDLPWIYVYINTGAKPVQYDSFHEFDIVGTSY